MPHLAIVKNDPNIDRIVDDFIKNKGLPEKGLDIQSAVDRLPTSIKRLAASADLELKGTLSVAKVDAALAKSSMPTMRRLELKVGLNKAGLLVD